MRIRDRSLLTQIEQGALDERVSLAATLRRCIQLGGQARSAELREWASRELNGYEGGQDLPEWRIIVAPLHIDGVAGRTMIKGKQISNFDLPEFAREAITDECRLPMGVAALESLLAGKDDFVLLGPPGAAELVLLWNRELDNFRHIERVYWSVSKTAITAVLDRIRTTLVELVAELRAGMPDDADLPAPELASQAVNVAVHGKGNRVVVTAAQSGVDANAEVAPATEPGETPAWKRWARIGGFAVGVVTIVGALAQFLIR